MGESKPHGPPPERRCKARSKQKGEQCGGWAMENGCCYYHGGKTGEGHGSGRHEGNQNAKRHGLYSRLVGPELLAEADQLRELPEDERLATAAAVLEVRFLQAAAKSDTPIDALARVGAKVIEHLMPAELRPGGVGGKGERPTGVIELPIQDPEPEPPEDDDEPSDLD